MRGGQHLRNFRGTCVSLQITSLCKDADTDIASLTLTFAVAAKLHPDPYKERHVSVEHIAPPANWTKVAQIHNVTPKLDVPAADAFTDLVVYGPDLGEMADFGSVCLSCVAERVHCTGDVRATPSTCARSSHPQPLAWLCGTAYSSHSPTMASGSGKGRCVGAPLESVEKGTKVSPDSVELGEKVYLKPDKKTLARGGHLEPTRPTKLFLGKYHASGKRSLALSKASAGLLRFVRLVPAGGGANKDWISERPARELESGGKRAR